MSEIEELQNDVARFQGESVKQAQRIAALEADLAAARKREAASRKLRHYRG